VRPVPGIKRLVDLDLVEDTPRFSTFVVSHRVISLFDDSTFFAVSIRALFEPLSIKKVIKNYRKVKQCLHAVLCNYYYEYNNYLYIYIYEFLYILTIYTYIYIVILKHLHFFILKCSVV